jgi:predicted MPP superfamily phosphohydrolase
MRLRRFLHFIVIVQSLLLLVHLLLYDTWIFRAPAGRRWTLWVFAALSVSFVAASLIALRYTNAVARAFYRAAAVWLGGLTFFAAAAVLAWIVFAAATLAGIALDFHRLTAFLFFAAAVASGYGLWNAHWMRITRATVRLENLPEPWRGRRAALISDIHLGHVRNGGFLRRLIAKILREEPHAVFIAGDLYDGTAIDAHRAAAPLKDLTAPHGVYFVAGNHEQFRDEGEFLRAISAAGVRVLANEKVEVDGLQIIGVPYRHAARDRQLASVLNTVGVDRDRASILLTHAPHHPQIAEAAGISLQLSGHTHLGQFIPWSWIARRVYRQFVYGLSRIGNMQVFTSSGAGTWGPPLRLGSFPEIVVLEFE